MHVTLRVWLVFHLLVCVPCLAGPGWADEPTPEQVEEWHDAYAAYEEDPVGNAERMVALIQEVGTQNVPAISLIVFGDAHLRLGNYGAARRMFLRALEDPAATEHAGPMKAPVADHAELGLAMVASATGKLDEARERFARTSDLDGDLGDLSTLGHAQSQIALGRHDEGLALLEELSSNDSLEPAVLEAARYSLANALLEAGEYEAAAEAFEALVADGMGVDAAYGAALARSHDGSPQVVLDSLAEVVELCPEPDPNDDGRAPTRADRALRSGAVLASWVRNYRESSFASLDSEAGGKLFSTDGCRLARASVEVLEAAPIAEPTRVENPEPASVAGQSTTTVAAEPEPEPEVAQAPSPARAPESPASEESPSRLLWILAGVALLVVVVLVVRSRSR